MNKNQGKRDNQMDDSNLFMAIALIALGVTIIISMIEQWLS
jgi:hypothetical protein